MSHVHHPSKPWWLSGLARGIADPKVDGSNPSQGFLFVFFDDFALKIIFLAWLPISGLITSGLGLPGDEVIEVIVVFKLLLG